MSGISAKCHHKDSGRFGITALKVAENVGVTRLINMVGGINQHDDDIVDFHTIALSCCEHMTLCSSQSRHDIRECVSLAQRDQVQEVSLAVPLAQ